MEKLNQPENMDWGLLAKVLSREAGESEKAEIEARAETSAENSETFRVCREAMDKSRLFFQSRRFNVARAWEKVAPELTNQQSQGGMRNVFSIRYIRAHSLRIAAMIVLAILLGSAGFYIGYRQHKTTVYTEVVSPERQVLQGISLPDGTRVTLNSNSKLTYPGHFTGKQREVSITGEAFFEVEPDKSKPFVISAGEARIKVLGTSFNVNARPENEAVEVVVASGKVEVLCGQGVRGCNGLILIPGERGVLYNESHRTEKSVNSNPNLLSWKTHDLVFQETRLSEVVHTLGMVYHTEIQISDPVTGDLTLTAHFRDQGIDFILEVIRLTFNLELTSRNGQYFLTARNRNQ
jgi:ferric-dicitrate binding protein FerR (iron transport regulator)